MIIAITESALNSDISDERLAIEGFLTNQKGSSAWEHSWRCHDSL